MAFVARIRAFSALTSRGAAAGVATVTGGDTRESGATSTQPAVSSTNRRAVYLTTQSHPINMRGTRHPAQHAAIAGACLSVWAQGDRAIQARANNLSGLSGTVQRHIECRRQGEASGPEHAH